MMEELGVTFRYHSFDQMDNDGAVKGRVVTGSILGGEETSSDEEESSSDEDIRSSNTTTSTFVDDDDFGQVEVFGTLTTTTFVDRRSDTKPYQGETPPPLKRKYSTTCEVIPGSIGPSIPKDEGDGILAQDENDDDFDFDFDHAAECGDEKSDVNDKLLTPSEFKDQNGGISCMSESTLSSMRASLRSVETRYGTGGEVSSAIADDERGSQLSSHDDHRTDKTQDADSSHISVCFAPTNIKARELRFDLRAKPSPTSARVPVEPSVLDVTNVTDVTYRDVEKFFSQSREMEKYRSSIVPEDLSGYTSVEKMKWKLRGRPSISYGHHNEGVEARDRVFLLARIPLLSTLPGAPMPPMHAQLLGTIYRAITRTKKAVAMSGQHWEQIGFQSGHPGRDLRDSGMLSLVQMLHFTEQMPALVRKMWLLSQDPDHEFPFMVTSIHFTLRVLVTLRQGRISHLCNAQQDVWGVVNRLHVALMLAFYREWSENKRRIADFAVVAEMLDAKMKTSAGCSELLDAMSTYNDDEDSDEESMVFTDLSAIE